MAIKIGANLAYNGKLPNFERDSFETKAAMKAFDENSIDEGHLSYCKEDGNIYQFKSANTVDTTTGRWRLFKTEADATLNGTSTNAIQNKAVFNVLKTKADVSILHEFQPIYKADYVAKQDLIELPITEGVIDLNGYQLNMTSVDSQGTDLTIINGTISFSVGATIKVSTLTFKNINITGNVGEDKGIKINADSVELINVFSPIADAFDMYLQDDTNLIHQLKIYNSNIVGSVNAKEVFVYQSYISLINNSTDKAIIKLHAYNSYALDNGYGLDEGSEWYNSQIELFEYTNGYIDADGDHRYSTFDDILENNSDNAPQTRAVYDALQLKADATALAAYQPKYKADYIATKDFNYSELPADAQVVDLNGYRMNIESATSVSNDFLNGTIIVATKDVTFDANGVTNCIIYSSNAAFNIAIVDAVFSNCSIQHALFSGMPEFYNCTLYDCTFGDSAPIIYNSIINNPKITGTTGYPLYNVIIDNVVYKKAIIKDGKFIEVGFESNITTPVLPGNAPSCEAVKTALQLKADKTQLADLATKTELNSKADASALNNYVTTTTANSTYAKKSDITNIYKFKGTKTNYADLPTTDRVTGDVWNITNANAEYGIKAGDNVAWNGTAWDNLSGTVDLSAYATTTTTDAMSADIKKLMDKAFPFTVKVSIDKTLAKKGTSQPVKVTITPKIGDDNTNVDAIMINGEEHHGAIPYVYSTTATTTTTYNVRADKTDRNSAHGSATITFVNPSYDGAVAANFTATEANIKALTETLRSGKGGIRTFNLNNQKACIAYPKSFGAATGIKDANGFDYLASYTRSELNVNGELYYVYLLTNAATITDMKQTIS